MSSVSTQDLLDAVNEVILKRLSGDAYIEYTGVNQRFRGESLESLMAIRDRLQQQVNASSGTSFGLLEPMPWGM